MSNQSKRVYTTLSARLGAAFEAEARARMISEANLLRLIISEHYLRKSGARSIQSAAGRKPNGNGVTK